MARYNEKLAERITTLVEEDAYTVAAICRIVGIGRKTFYKWRQEKPAFAEALHEAECRRMDDLRQAARTALRRKLEGQTQTVYRTVYVPSKEDPSQLEIKQYVVTEKHCEADTSTILNVLGDKITGQPAVKGNETGGGQAPISIKVNEEKVQEQLSHLDKEKKFGKAQDKKSDPEPVIETDKGNEVKIEKKDDGSEKDFYKRQEDLKKRYDEINKTRFVPPPLHGIPYK